MSINDDKCFQWIQQRSFFIRAILNPIYICKFHKVKTFLWFMFVIVAGQLGTIINIIQRTVFDNWPIGKALIPDSLHFLIGLISFITWTFVYRFHKR